MCRAGLTQPTKACLKEHTNVIARVGPRHASVLNMAVSDQSGLNLGGSRHAIRPTNHSTQPTIKMDPFKRSSTPDMLKRSSTPENIFQYNPHPTSPGPIVGNSGSSEQVTGLAGHSILAPDVPAVKRSPAKKKPNLHSPRPQLRLSLRIFNQGHGLGSFTTPASYFSVKETRKYRSQLPPPQH
ncbi:uncharacterized protein PGTG_13165 [Puccinia graminis f. sp. tritici CRL 75-36-700-3]|uniref:Uncharacterized protein n=1 Tax=Puccinia graminis f. sp. tritici (strain CRL 75-36-700-3 / race SCCL) TaxID=418459 RepID=E3KR58_PUCGT|nr:uncharacterized protein PGTG_13165 [Puccinia graminis f. sp. tritici CRL 75-36-700-3]EFP86783.2 hypothetical protein PGTG_13165 [Puccinia graminis f. sp. tritici CRL 75-36-700-3]